MNAGIRQAFGLFVVAPSWRPLFNFNTGLRRVTPARARNSILDVLPFAMGHSPRNPCPRNANAQQVTMFGVDALAVDEQNTLFISDGLQFRILRMTKPFPGFRDTDILAASSDGSEVYKFDASGRHLQTLEGRTGSILLNFSYDTLGFLSRIEDTEGNVTIVERDASGTATGIVESVWPSDAYRESRGRLPGVGPRTRRRFDKSHVLLRRPVEDTARAEQRREHTFIYDDYGLLETDRNPAGATTTITATNTPGVSERVTTSIMGHATRYRTTQLSSRVLQRMAEEPTGLQSTATMFDNDSTVTITPDGTVTTSVFAADPRFGTQSLRTAFASMKLPVSGVTSSMRSLRRVDTCRSR